MPRSMHGLIGLAGFMVAWEATVRLGLIDRAAVPTPSDVATRLTELLGQEAFLRDVLATVLAWLIAIVVAAGIAVPAGLLLGGIRWLRVATRALVEVLRPIPPVALIPLVVILVGSGPEAKITLAVYASVWPILFNIIYALDDIDPLLVDTARSFGHRRMRIMATVALPHAAPFAFTGLRVSAAIALIVVVSTEYLAGSAVGVGQFLIRNATGPDAMDLVLAGTVLIGLFGTLVNSGLEWAGRHLFGWTDQHRTVPATQV